MKLRWLILGLLGSLALAQGFGGKAGVGGKAGIGGGVPSGGAVAFDAVGPTSGTTTSAGAGSWTTLTVTWTHVVASGGSLVAGCLFAANNTNLVATMATTYNGTGMTSAGTVIPDNTAGQGLVQMWTMLSPTSGSHSAVTTVTYVSGTAAAGDTVICGSISFTGVTGFGTAVTAFGSSAAASSGAVTSATGHMVVDVVGTGTSITSSGQTMRWHDNSADGLASQAVGQSTAAGASSVTMSYVVANDVWGIIAADVQ